MSRDPELEISTDRARVDLDVVHGFLKTSYWSPGVPREVVERAVQNSLCFSAFIAGRQVGFARVITDQATFAYLADVFVLPKHRGNGIGSALIAAVMAHPALQHLRRRLLATRDAHELYARFGFQPLAEPSLFMEITTPDIYTRLDRA